MPRRSAEKAAGAALAAVASGLYLNHRYGIYADVKDILLTRSNQKAVTNRIKELGDNVTLYRMMQLCPPDAEALWFEGRTWTYAQLKMDIDQFANILEQYGVVTGQSVAVFTTNSPEMVISYTALQKIGAVPAMINTSLRSQTLSHCLNVAKAKLLICTPDLAPSVVDLFDETSQPTQCLSVNLSSFPPLKLSDSPHADHVRQIRYEDLHAVTPSTTPLPRRTITDSGALVYTSGTSGKPKAVNIKNILMIVVSTPHALDRQDPSRYFPLRTYTCLPLYHGTCLFTGLYYSFGTGGALCLARKFSASGFSQDLVRSRATRTLYVGELCRYMLRAPPSPHDTAHKVIVACGNGLARDVWLKFKSRFGIPEVREFYRSTEGMAKFDNYSGDPRGAGCVGFAGPLRRWYETDTFLVKYDSVTEKPWRDPTTGFCVTVGPNEPGEAIGRIANMSLYHEYLDNPQANSSKIIRDVFAKGDAFQRMGDLLVRDPSGWISFLDRTGDTYRWRGENVSAGEVRECFSRFAEVADCSVYAVRLPGYDGQAGAAALTLTFSSSGEDSEAGFMEGLYARLRRAGMTTYQVPRLVRVVAQVETNATFKHAKEVLKKRSWDPSSTVVISEEKGGEAPERDRLYWLNGETYCPLTSPDWKEIEAGRARL